MFNDIRSMECKNFASKISGQFASVRGGQFHRCMHFLLKDSQTIVSFSTPKYLDTSMKWINGPCGIYTPKFRVQNKKQPIYLDGGYSSDEVPWAKTEVTFKEQFLNEEQSRLDLSTVIKDHNFSKEDNKGDPETTNLYFDTILRVDSIFYSILGYNLINYRLIKNFNLTKSDSNKQNKHKLIILSSFYAGKSYLRVRFENSNNKIEDTKFTNDCIEIIKSIKIINSR